MKKVIIGIVAVCLVIGVVFFVQSRRELALVGGKPVIKIGFIYPLSGNLAAHGKAAQHAAKLFFDEFNKGEHFFDYQLIWEDNQFKSAVTAAVANKLIALDKVDVIMTLGAAPGSILNPIAEQNKILHFGVGPDTDIAKGFYNFVGSGNRKMSAEILYQALVNRGIRRMSIVGANTDYTHNVVKNFHQVAEREKKIDILNTYFVNPDERDLRIMLIKIKNEKPDAVFITLSPPLPDIFLRQAREAKLNVSLFSDSILNLLEQKQLANDMIVVNEAGALDNYLARYKALAGTDTTYFAEYLDTNLRVLTNAYEQTKSADPTVVANYIMAHREISESAMGPLTIDEEGAIYGQPVLTKIENGKAIRIEK